MVQAIKVEDDRTAAMADHMIGGARCLLVRTCNAGRKKLAYKAGVVRVGGKNLVIVVQVACGSILRVVAPHNHPNKFKKHPHLSPWEPAKLADARNIISGETPIERGASLGDSMYDYLGMGG